MIPPLPAWADQFVCELACPRCRGRVFIPLRGLAAAAPAHCPCGHAWPQAVPPGLPETLELLAQLERVALRAGEPLPAPDPAATR